MHIKFKLKYLRIYELTTLGRHEREIIEIT